MHTNLDYPHSVDADDVHAISVTYKHTYKNLDYTTSQPQCETTLKCVLYIQNTPISCVN